MWLYFIHRYTKLGYAGNTEPQFIIPSGRASWSLLVLNLLTVLWMHCRYWQVYFWNFQPLPFGKTQKSEISPSGVWAREWRIWTFSSAMRRWSSQHIQSRLVRPCFSALILFVYHPPWFSIAVAHPAWNCGWLGFNGAFLRALHLQISPLWAGRSLYVSGMMMTQINQSIKRRISGMIYHSIDQSIDRSPQR